jgi:hypothetical protein
MTRIAITLGVIFLQATCGYAASSDVRPASSIAVVSADSYRPGDTPDHVRVKMVNRDAADENKVVVIVEIDAGFHINANPASLDYLIPTTLNVTNQTPVRIIYPQAIRFKPKFADETLDVYEGTIRITAEFPDGSLTRTPYLFGTVTAQACTDEVCLPPADLVLPPI